MTKFFEIDFLEAGNNGSGDAIAVRYADDGDVEYVHVIDGGYADDGDKIVEHINKYYGNPNFIDHMVLTHPDGDHAAGLKKILEEFDIGILWMNRPWNHIHELIPLFEYEYTETGLTQRLKKDFSHTASLEEIAEENDVEIRDSFQGAQIGEFTVLAPSRNRYIQLIVDSEKTPEPERKAIMEGSIFQRAITAIKNVVVEWGEENLKGDTEGTSAENESSIVQLAEMCGKKILMTGDAGVGALEEAYYYALALGIDLPGIDRLDVPHHGSRRNVSPDVMDKWLGPKLASKSDDPTFHAIVSANSNDIDHPKKAVIRALIHRGAKVVQTNGTIRTSMNAPEREGWSSATPLEYPADMEE
ncbi:MAG: MBL fold metallo-hydrolase [Candidatus Thiodiazotropha sp. (ex Troendleina suluensis)]|nr:MBL fold metallo-hydrolase [Candidatus Thiodiazotropha sp. (ex Troendleina suluensis)]